MPKLSLDKLIKEYTKQREDLVRKLIDAELANDAELLQKRVRAEFSSSVKSLAMAIFGFENRWGGWELKSDKDLPVKQAIQEMAMPIAKEWFKDIMKEPPGLNKKEMRELIRAFKDDVLDHAGDALRETVEEEGNKLAEMISLRNK
jgi:hypothetical protein